MKTYWYEETEKKEKSESPSLDTICTWFRDNLANCGSSRGGGGGRGDDK